ncbi:MAG: Mu-like prophage major head subunit gpT family protein [Fimbriimonadaceae bacterium]|nr:Mu-like prophage major head subunit gpT family protein [Fimbriimonadaceae bacterium]
MPVTTSDISALVLPGLRAEFALAYRNALDDNLADRIATVINTTLPNQTYAWLSAAPPMREFIDERRLQGLTQNALSIQDKTFESTIAVDRRALEDDQMDLIRMRVRDLAARVASHRHQLVVEALLAGNTAVGPDGVAHFAETHPGFSGNQRNITTDLLTQPVLADAMAEMMEVSDDSGVPLGIVPDTLLVGPQNYWNAIELVESPVVVYRGNDTDTAPSTPYQNAAQGRLTVAVSPFIRGGQAAAWFLLDTKRPMRSIILQQRSDVPVEFVAMDSGNASESAFLRDRYLYGVRGRYNVGLGLWQTAYAGALA